MPTGLSNAPMGTIDKFGLEYGRCEPHEIDVDSESEVSPPAAAAAVRATCMAAAGEWTTGRDNGFFSRGRTADRQT